MVTPLKAGSRESNSRGHVTRARERPLVALLAYGVHGLGGEERAAFELVKRTSSEFRYLVVSCELDEDLQNEVEWLRIPAPRRPAPLRFVFYYLLAPVLLARRKPDLIHSVGAISPVRTDVVTVQFCNLAAKDHLGGLAPSGMPPLLWLNTALYRLMRIAAEKWLYRPGRLKVFAAVSQGIRSELQTYFPGLPVERTPNGVDLQRFRPSPASRREIRSKQGVATDETVLLFVGGDWERKRLALALQALALAQRQTQIQLILWVVGRGDESRYRKMSEELGICDSVQFFGFRTDPERYCQGADIFLFPTSYEAFPLVALEAAACGLPIIATPANGIGELLAEGRAGRIVTPEPQAIADAIATLASNRPLRLRLGREAAAEAQAYNWSDMVELVRSVYERVLMPSTRRSVEAVE
jgi:UDP-glucose:(heptosyl)LPS alpha-1,3-glucosyltransferase